MRAVVVHFFRRATAEVEAGRRRGGRARGRAGRLPRGGRRAAQAGVRRRSSTTSPPSPAAREIYERNTAAAARRVEQLVAEGVACGAFRPVHVGFVADLSAAMVRIQQRRVAAATGLDDSAAYAELAALVVDGLAPRG